MRRAWGWMGALCWAASGCADVEPQVSFAYDPELSERLVAKAAGWRAACDREPRQRLGVPATLQRELNPRPVPQQFAVHLANVVKGLPRPFDKLFRRHVCAVVLIHGAPMSGTLRVLEGDDKRGIILLNVDNLSRTPNEWLAFKESTAFEAAPELSIRGKLAEAGDNVPGVLLEFVLVHELAHVVDAVFPDHLLIAEFKSASWPRTDALAETPFVHYPERKNVKPLPDAQLEPYYDLIAQGAFAAPASVSNSIEDFAESVATYEHTVMRGRPWQLEVQRHGQLVRKLETCWAEPRCGNKRRILETLLERWGAD